MMERNSQKSKRGFFIMRFSSIVFLFVSIVLLFPLRGFISAQEKEVEALSFIKGNKIELTLKSVIFLALKNNLQIAFESLGPNVSETDIMREESVYDTNVSLQFGKDRRITQTGNFLAGAGESSIYQQSWDLEVDVMKKFVSGTSAELKWNSSDSKTDFLFQALVPEYRSELNLLLTQPLLKDFGIDIGKSMIKIANLNFKISQHRFKDRVMDILYEIEKQYWNLYFQIKDYEAREKSLKLAEDLLREFKIKIEAGTLAPIEIYQAEAEVATRKEDLIVTRDLLKDSEDRLKSALNFYEKEQYWDLVIIPADEPRPAVPKEDLMEGIKEAFKYRPDYNQAKMDIEARNIMVKYTKNQVLPRVDLFGTIGTMGLGGRGNPDAIDFAGGGNGGKDASSFSTHWDDVADHMASGDFYNYTIGIKIEFPLGNRFAKSQYSKAKVEALRAATYLKDLENIIINEMRGAVRQVETNLEMIEAARASLKLADEKLKAEEKKYEVGLSTTHDLLEFQEDLARAESREARTLAEYEKSLVNLARVKGLLLEEHNITID
jgi:outer membrane protein TolC